VSDIELNMHESFCFFCFEAADGILVSACCAQLERAVAFLLAGNMRLLPV